MTKIHKKQDKQTFLQTALSRLRTNLRSAFSKAGEYRKRASKKIDVVLSNFHEYIMENKLRVIVWITVICWLALSIWFVVEWKLGKVEGDALQTGVGGFFGGIFMGGFISPVVAIAAYCAVLALNGIVKLTAPIVLFVPVMAWVPVYAVWQTVIVVWKTLLLIPLSFLFVVTRMVQALKGIFHTCPNSRCAYRGLPGYVCEKCGASNPKLWPNLYGLFKHNCVQCETLLPTLDILGRNKLSRRCGNSECAVPLTGRHAGKVRERLVAIVGGVSSGKTNYLLMTVNAIIEGAGKTKQGYVGELDDPGQEEQYREEFQYLSEGVVAAKTAEIVSAFLLYIKRPKKFQLYLYDAPGEEFASIGGMSQQHYIPLLEGIVLLVDPLCFSAVREKMGDFSEDVSSLKETVDSMLVNALARFQVTSGKKIPLRIAVVISKADMLPVQEKIGDIRQQPIPSSNCRQAICDWGSDMEVFKIEQRFEQVEYFACTALGRESSLQDKTPFKAAGVLEPIQWVLA